MSCRPSRPCEEFAPPKSFEIVDDAWEKVSYRHECPQQRMGEEIIDQLTAFRDRGQTPDSEVAESDQWRSEENPEKGLCNLHERATSSVLPRFHLSPTESQPTEHVTTDGIGQSIDQTAEEKNNRVVSR